MKPFLPRAAGLALILAWVMCGSAYGAMSEESSQNAIAPSIDETRTMLEKWIETQQLISQEKRDMELAREMLNEQIGLVEREIETLKDKISTAKSEIADKDKKREELLAENDSLKQASEALKGMLLSLEIQTRQLLGRLPNPIRETIKPLSQQLPEKPEETKLSVAQRFQNVVGILNQVDKFNRDITTTSEVRSLPDGSSVEVAVIYLGVGQAFYTSNSGTIGGIGTATGTEWVWKPNNDKAAQIAEAIAILKNEKAASFVQVPVEIN